MDVGIVEWIALAEVSTLSSWFDIRCSIGADEEIAVLQALDVPKGFKEICDATGIQGPRVVSLLHSLKGRGLVDSVADKVHHRLTFKRS